MTSNIHLFFDSGRKAKGGFCNVIFHAVIFILIVVACSCSTKSTYEIKTTLDSTKTKSVTEEENIWSTCSFSNKEFAYEIDSCNCGDIHTTYDTIFIDLFQYEGGEIQGRLLKINNPKCDSSYFILMKHQNRYWTSSMGPDPIYDDWLLYNSPLDTVRYDPKRKGFYINIIPQIEQERFPKFDTLDFYKAYKRAVGENLNSSNVPDIAKSALYSEYSNYKQNIREILEESGAELHRIILVLRQGNSEKKVIVFTYGHFG